MAETVTITAELLDEVSGPATRAAASVAKANEQVERSSRRSSSRLRSDGAAVASATKKAAGEQTKLQRATERATRGAGRAWQGLTGAVRSAGAKVRAAAEKSGGEAGRGMGERMSSIFNITVGNLLAKGIAGIASGVSGIISGAISGGFARVSGIENAQAKLRGLGNDAKSVDTIMSNALASVEGTSFGLDDAATVAAGAVAAGIKPGKALEGTLKAVSNSAAASGTDLSEMGAIFNKVAASNKAQGDVLAQVADRGLPIYQALADTMGVTTDEVFKLSAAGKIGFAEFEQAMVSASGTVAKEMGTTFTGTLSRFQSAFSRVGATILQPLMAAGAGIMEAVIPYVDRLNKALQPIMERFGAWVSGVGERVARLREALASGQPADIGKALGLSPEATERVAAIIDTVRGAIDRLRGISIPWGTVLGAGTLTVVGGLIFKAGGFLASIGRVIGPLLPLLSQLGGLFRFLTGPIGIITGLLVAAYTGSEQFRTAVNGLLPVVMGLGQQLLGALVPVITQLAQTLLPVLVGLFQQVAPVLGQVLAAVIPVVVQLVSALVPVLMTLISAVLPVFASLLSAVVPILGSLLSAVLPIIPPVAQLIAVFVELIASVLTPIMPLISSVAALLGGILVGAIKLVSPVVEGLLGVFSGFVSWLSGTLGPMIERVSGWFRDLGSVIGGAVNGLKDFAANPLGGIQAALGMAGGGVVGLAGGGALHAAGGVIAGHQAGVDSVPIMASRGESVLVPELTRMLGADNIRAANWAASRRRGGTGTVSAGRGANPRALLGGQGAVQLTVNVEYTGRAESPAQMKAHIKAALREVQAEQARRSYR